MFRKRWVRRSLAGILIGIVLIIAGVYVDRYFTRRSGEKKNAAIVDHLDATDPRWRYEEIDADRGQLPDEQNGALLVPKFTAALAQPRFDKDSLLDTDYASSVLPNRVLDDATYEALNAALGNNEQALQIAISFTNYPKGLRRYVLPPNPLDTLLPEAQETRAIYRLLDLASEYYCRNGRGGTALGYIEPMMNAGRSLDGEPF